MSDLNCPQCQQSITKKNESLHCRICDDEICKKCAHFVQSEDYSFLPKIPQELETGSVCDACQQSKVQPLQMEYEEWMDQAKNVFVFFVTQRKEIPMIRKDKELLKVPHCVDRDETILRLAFFAAQKGFNAIVDVEVKSKKVRNEAYQTSEWSGSGYAASVDEEKLERQYLRNQIYR